MSSNGRSGSADPIDRLRKDDAAPEAPSDFTDYRPAPRPGTLEIWLSSG